jgi:hypothetical protein
MKSMKTAMMPYLMHIFRFLLLTTFISANDLPEDVQRLISKRDLAIAQIDIRFVEELDKLKVKYTKAGDLDAANAIVSLIEKTPVKVMDNVPAKEAHLSLDGKWLYRRGSATEGGTECRISGRYLIRPNGRHKIEQKEGQVTIDFGGGVVHKFDIIDENTLRGKNHFGNTYQYVRVNE